MPTALLPLLPTCGALGMHGIGWFWHVPKRQLCHNTHASMPDGVCLRCAVCCVQQNAGAEHKGKFSRLTYFYSPTGKANSFPVSHTHKR